MTIFFTADSHFGHHNIIKYSNRPFRNVDHMNDELILRWNSKVGSNDTVYHLGDLTLGEDAQFYFKQLKGKIFILPGSHDQRWWKKEYYKSMDGWPVILLPPIAELTIKELKVNIGFGPAQFPTKEGSKGILVLCHYAMLRWPLSHYGSYHLFGHSHGKLEGQPNSFDVGVDCTDFYPLSLDEVMERFHV